MWGTDRQTVTTDEQGLRSSPSPRQLGDRWDSCCKIGNRFEALGLFGKR
jgi:hypothetical protein